ncbi:ankyrin-1-like [Lingula anatina]|uniref:Ankyrin-1-like n=1 Tax=Lingula anatina TaxID=7574 RepID=A0A1S3IT57_LINAN|nr:ankyrin-1-like [Lingula anatina]|eukprot:XP_013401263.1 ankyrin-1-like [Lingula anatina]
MGNSRSRHQQKLMKASLANIMYHAVSTGHLPTVRNTLLNPLLDINQKVDKYGSTALHLAAEKGWWECVQLLIENGANPNTQDVSQMTPLHFAAAQGTVKSVEALLSCKIDINLQDVWKRTPLHKAIINHKVEAAVLLIKKKCCVNVPDLQGRLPLHSAASYGNEYLVRLLLDHGANIDWQDGRGRTALYLAVLARHQGLVELLIEWGCDCDLQTKSHVSPLLLATQKGHVELVEILLNGGAKVNTRTKIQIVDIMQRYPIPLESAMLRVANITSQKFATYLKITRMLIEADAVCPEDNLFWVLYRVLKQNNSNKDLLELMALLLAAGCRPSVSQQFDAGVEAVGDGRRPGDDPNSDSVIKDLIGQYSCMPSLSDCARRSLRLGLQSHAGNVICGAKKLQQNLALPAKLMDIILIPWLTRMGNTRSRHQQKLMKASLANIMYHAVSTGHLPTVRNTLLNPLLDINQKVDKYGSTALHLAAEKGWWECVQLLIENGANPNTQDVSQMTPLHFAAAQGTVKSVEALLSCKIDINLQDVWKRTPLHKAIINHKVEAAVLLIKKKCCVNVPDLQGRLPLHSAASYGNEYLVGLLLDHGANIDWQDGRGRTALYLAVLARHRGLVELLIERGCDCDLQTKSHVSPLLLATQKGHVELVEILLNGGAKVNTRTKIQIEDIMQRYPIPLESAMLRVANITSQKFATYLKITRMLIEADAVCPEDNLFWVLYRVLKQNNSNKDLLELMALLLAAGCRPSVSQQFDEGVEAVGDGRRPGDDPSSDSVIKDLIGQYSCMPSLSDCARRSLRLGLQSHAGNVICGAKKLQQNLGLPAKLMDIILMRDI